MSPIPVIQTQQARRYKYQRREVCMPRFYFDYFERGIEIGHDTEGTELEDVSAAFEEARAFLGEMTKEALRRICSDQEMEIRVRDDKNEPVLVCSVTYQSSLVE
jgi:hypothetical protein